MSKMSKNLVNEKDNSVVNFMGGTSYTLSPIDTLKIVTASSIFGEPQYYREGEFSSKVSDGIFHLSTLFKDYCLFSDMDFYGKKTSTIMEEVIDSALDYDFEATIRWAETLRSEYLMRLNPQIIMVRAAIHPKRVEFTKKNPTLFGEINDKVMSRADEPSSQLTYYLYVNKSKSKCPAILKRSWARKLNKLSKYQIYKYRNANVGMINTVRICHANSPALDELMRTGTVQIESNEQTWESMRAKGASWAEILDAIKLGHMALLRNLRGIFTEIQDFELCKKLMKQLKDGVINGKQFPFRYMSAYKRLTNCAVHHKQLILDTLEECMDIACDNLPKLGGKTMCLSDNSGSAWGAITSEYGTVTVAEIDNLSSVIAAKGSDEGYVGKFGDTLETYSISHRNGVLEQAQDINRNGYHHIGGSTENGIWLFFDKAITNKEHWDNIFIYSDMQAGHGGLYGTYDQIEKYTQKGFACRGRYIDVAKLIDTYRKTVNPKVNVYCIQTAGYDNVVVPESGYRTSILHGWTGKELVYADMMNRFWDEFDNRQ